MPRYTMEVGTDFEYVLAHLEAVKSVPSAEIMRRALAVYKVLHDETLSGQRKISITKVSDDTIIKDVILP